MKMVNRFKNYLSMRMHGYDMRKAETEQKQCLSAAITPVDFRPTNDGFYIQIDGETYVQCLVVGNPSPVNSGRQGIPPKSSTSIVDDILSIAAQSETCWEVAQILFPLPPDDENKELEGARRSNAVASVMQEEEDKGIVKMHNRINDFVTEGIDDYHRKVYDGESRLYKFAFIIAVQGVSIRDVDKTMNIIKSKLDSKRILHETPRYGMVDVFKSMMPTPFVVERILDTILGDTAAKMCPLRNLNPRLANSGRFIGMNDKTKNSIFIKFDGGNEDVVSGHSLVIGKSGSGKSTELLKDDIRAVADGDDALHTVPKDDDTTNHVRACKAMDGQLIKIGHGGTNFNMLQVFFDPSRMEDSKDSSQKAYSEHVFTMTTCLGLLVGDGFSDAQKNWLYSSLATLYERFSVVDSKGDVINTDTMARRNVLA